MKPGLAVLLLIASLSHAQEIPQDLDQLRNLINAGDWAKAAELSRSLKERVAKSRNEALAAGGAAVVESILTWMPANTETLLVARQPFTIKDSAIASFLASLLGAAEKGALLKRLENRPITLAVIGGRKFGEGGPTDNVPRLGMIPYEGCGLYQLPEAPSDSLLARPPEEKLLGYSIWHSRGSEGDGPDWQTFYATLANPGLLTVCNNHEFLEALLSGKTTPRQPRALPANLTEWSLIDRAAPVWGITHYPRGKPLGFVLDTPAATGLAVSFGKAVITARMISAADPWEDLVSVPEFRNEAKARKAADGVWELTVPADGQAGAVGLLALAGLLGFAVVI